MKALITADIHAHAWKEFGRTVIDPFTQRPINSRLLQQLGVLYDTVRRANKKGVDTFIMAGDLFHVKGQVPAEVFQPVYDFIHHMVKDLSWRVILLTGNHDHGSADGSIHTVYGFRDLCDVIDSPTHWTLDGVEFHFIPYIKDHKLLKEIVAGDSSDVLVMHAAVDGAEVGPIEYRVKEPLTLADLPKKPRWRLLGHYHKPQKLDKRTFYIGSPMQISRGERGDTKRVLLLDTETMKLTSMATCAPEFYTVTSEEFRNLIDPPGGYYDVVMQTGENPAELPVYDNISIKPVFPATKVKRVQVDLEDGLTDDLLMKRYVRYKLSDQPKSVRKATLEVGRKLMTGVEGEGATAPRLVLRKVQVQNFMSIGSATLKLNRPGSVVAVLGDNQDNPGFQSNGAGKSSLLPESIYWCLYGKTARKLPAAKVVNNVVKRDCVVTLNLLVGKDKVTVQRFRKCRELGGDGLHLYINGQCVDGADVAETTAKLEKLLGIDYLTFSSVIAFSQDNLQFVSATDASQKQVLDALLHTARFGEALGLAKATAKDLKTSMQKHQEEIQRGEGRSEGLEDNLRSYLTQADTFDAREDARIAGVRQRLKELRADRDTHAQNLEETQNSLDTLKAARTDAPTFTSEVEAAIVAKSEAQAAVTFAAQQVRAIERTLATIQNNAESTHKMVGQPCPTCGQTMKHLGKLLASLTAQRQEALDLQKKTTADLLLRQNHLKQTEDKLQEIRRQQAAWIDTDSKVQSLERTVQQLIAARQRCVSSLLELKTQLKRGENTWSHLAAETQAQLDDLQASLRALQEKVDRRKELLSYVEFWVDAFGNAGLKNFLLEQIIPDLTRYANEYLEFMAPALSVEFEVFSESGQAKFKIKAMNSQGSDVYEGNSSGERRRVDLCVMLALFRVAHTRCAVNILLLDEVMDTLDETGIESAVDLLSSMAQNLQLSVFVTSHVMLSDLLHESLTVMKRDGLACVLEG